MEHIKLIFYIGGVVLAFLVQFAYVVWRFSKLDSDIKNISEKFIPDFKREVENQLVRAFKQNEEQYGRITKLEINEATQNQINLNQSRQLDIIIASIARIENKVDEIKRG